MGFDNERTHFAFGNKNCTGSTSSLASVAWVWAFFTEASWKKDSWIISLSPYWLVQGLGYLIQRVNKRFPLHTNIKRSGWTWQPIFLNPKKGGADGRTNSRAKSRVRHLFLWSLFYMLNLHEGLTSTRPRFTKWWALILHYDLISDSPVK